MAAAEQPIGPLKTMSASRRLLASVRDVMAGAASAQEQLDEIVRIIASDMVAEVCSVYARRGGDVLELFATQGLKSSAVHQTRLRFGEGIVGDVAQTARALALSNAQQHPNFAYRPETGEEIFNSMMGVPVLRSGRVVGVIVVQNRTQRHYTEEEIETLQTVAMVLAELIANGGLFNQTEILKGVSDSGRSIRIEGISLNGGLGIGRAVLHVTDFSIAELVADNPKEERSRLHVAFSAMHGYLDQLLADDAFADGGEHRDILETYRLIAEDAGWLTRIEDAIETGLTAEAAVQRVQDDIRARMAKVTDPYLQERVHDLDDLARRLLRHLIGDIGKVLVRDLPEHTVLIARSMGPADLLDYDHDRLDAVVLEEGSPDSHVAIIARALDIPIVGRVRNIIQQVDIDEKVIVDADNGQVIVRPSSDLLSAFEAGVRKAEDQRHHYESLFDKAAETRDGVRIELCINAGLMVDMKHLVELNADGIGLFRTEIVFMARSKLLGVDEQTKFYRRIMDQAEGKPVVFRTLDIGGDKMLPHWGRSDGENPAMGWRAIRVSLDQPALMRRQLRALIRATDGRDLNVMFPMVAEVAEFEAARELLDLELERENSNNRVLPKTVSAGVMLEIPSLGFQLPALLERADFLSVGSNDLTQFLFARDRGDARLAERYDILSPIVLEFLRFIAAKCESRSVPLSLCGEMASQPLEAMALIGIGFRRISVAPGAFGQIKAMIRGLNVGALVASLPEFGDSPEHSMRDVLLEISRDQGIQL